MNSYYYPSFLENHNEEKSQIHLEQKQDFNRNHLCAVFDQRLKSVAMNESRFATRFNAENQEFKKYRSRRKTERNVFYFEQHLDNKFCDVAKKERICGSNSTETEDKLSG